MTGNQTHRMLLILGFGITCAVLTLGVLPVLVGAAAPDLPPRPATPTPQPPPRPRPRAKPAGAWIELNAQYSDLSAAVSWEELWTTVQWQDGLGRWHDVEGWSGNLDEAAAADGAGRKMWWVAEKDFGAGPFRWIVQHGNAEEGLSESEPFSLPRAAGETLQVKVMLVP